MKKQHSNSRREFIESLLALAGTTALAGTVPWINSLKAQPPGKVSASDKVRIAVIGVGSRGKLLTLLLKQIPEAEIVAVCDNYEPHFERAKQLTDNKAKAFYDYRDLLEIKNLDAVVIATPLHQHAHIAIDAMNAGLHVFCEKSMAKTIEDTHKMVETQKANDRILVIGHQRLFNIKYLEAMKQIREGRLGKITQIKAYWHRNNDWRRPVPQPGLERKINWRLYREYSRGLMTELASHQIQVANWILQETPEKVWGVGGINHWHDGREVYDNVQLVYAYPGGTHLIYDSMTSNRHYGLEEQIMGPKGTMELEIGKYYDEDPPPAPGILQLINNMEKQFFESVPIGGASWVPETVIMGGSEPILDQYPLPNDTQLQLEGFVQFVKDGKAPEHLTKEGMNATIAAILGDEAMLQDKILSWPQNKQEIKN